MGYKDKDKQRAYVREWVKQRRKKWLAENGPCVDCGSSENLEVDHVDPLSKISHNVWSWREDRRLNELAKCQVRCAKCHMIKTVREFKERFTKDRHGTRRQYLAKGCRCDLCRTEYSRYRKLKYLRCGN